MMTRVSRGVVRHAKRKKILKQAKGFRGRAKNCLSLAKHRVRCHKTVYPYISRKLKKREFRTRFIRVINAFSHSTLNINYSQFMGVFNKSKYKEMLDRKALSIIIQQDAQKVVSIYNDCISANAKTA